MTTPANPTVSTASGGAFSSSSTTNITTGTSDDNARGGLFSGGASTSIEAEISASLKDISDLVELAQSAASTATTQASNASASAVTANSAKNSASASASTAGLEADEAASAADQAVIAAEEAQGYVSATATNASTASTAASNASASATLASGYAANASTSETNAGISRDLASGYATSASTSATNSSNSATASANSATASAASASSANTSASAAATSASNASTSATAAQTAQTAAETAKTDAEAAQVATQNIFDQFGDQYLGAHASDSAAAAYVVSEGYTLDAGDIYWNTTDSKLRFYNGSAWVEPETIATTAATNAQTSESNAADSASDAEKLAINPVDSQYTLSDGVTTGYSALHYGTKAIDAQTGAETAETNAQTYATNASTSASNALTYSNNASTSATASANSATDSANSATASATSATNAATSATSAATSATNAATSETNASTFATNASNSATDSANSATAAATSASNAATSESNTAALYDSFDDRYLGAKASDPILDNDGNALLTGALYFDTTLVVMKVYTGTLWKIVPEVTGDIVVDSIQLTGATGTIGTISWNTEEETADLIVSPDVTYQLGQELGVVARNLSGATLFNGAVVKVTGASGNKITVELADNTAELGSSETFAVVTEEILNNGTGHITTNGLVRDLNTLGLTEGAAIWLGTSGGFTTTKPITPAHLVHIGWVIRSHATEGSVLVRISNGWEVEELHDVLITNITDNELLQWNATSGYWENQTISEAGLATSAQGSLADSAVQPGDNVSTLTNDANYGTTDEALALSIALG